VLVVIILIKNPMGENQFQTYLLHFKPFLLLFYYGVILLQYSKIMIVDMFSEPLIDPTHCGVVVKFTSIVTISCFMTTWVTMV
jgi:hypothetical protein